MTGSSNKLFQFSLCAPQLRTHRPKGVGLIRTEHNQTVTANNVILYMLPKFTTMVELALVGSGTSGATPCSINLVIHKAICRTTLVTMGLLTSIDPANERLAAS